MYAMNREYSAAYGRFLTPDPYMASGGVADPGSWNRYAYTQGDPVNYTDPSGLYLSVAGLPPATPLVAINTSEIGVARLLGLAESEHYELFLARQVGGRGQKADGDGTPLGYAGALDRLKKENCYSFFGFSSAKAAATAFGAVDFRRTAGGMMVIQQTPSGDLEIQNRSPAVAQTVDKNIVEVNYDYNWVDFSRVPAFNSSTGKNETFDFFSAANDSLNTTMNTPQLAALILLHEFRHTVNGGDQPQEKDFKAFNSEIYDRCLR
ncbi:MAG: hypothetical protein IT160_09550 [Bryobacterales bacterium]|nr:hypothetical protein [Bryobacterales bacterium]